MVATDLSNQLLLYFSLTDGEKEKLLQKKKLEEEKLRQSGELQGMERLLIKLPEVHSTGGGALVQCSTFIALFVQTRRD